MTPIPNYPGYFATAEGEIYSNRCGLLRKLPKRLHKGYYRVNVRDGGTPVKSHVEPVHKLILEAFSGPRPLNYVCRHLNGVATDNRLENICWGTQKENAQDAIRHGTAVCLRVGERHIRAKLTEKDIMQIKKLYADGLTQKQIAELYPVTQRHISDIVNLKTWTHLSFPVGE
ncbi:MAG: HNH endonuclease [Ruminococcaceae bacterium]|nr:HNH endonuclease [Oscillospiraceae bacterium]